MCATRWYILFFLCITTMRSLAQFDSTAISSLKKNKSGLLSSVKPYYLHKIIPGSKKVLLTGGYNNYTFSYTGYIDTPISQSAVRQHYLNGYLGINFFGIPLSVSYLINRSNAVIFRNITDVQVGFNSAEFTQLISKQYSGIINDYVKYSLDSLEKLTLISQPFVSKYLSLKEFLNSPVTVQLLQEYKQILSLPPLSYKIENSDSLNKVSHDSIVVKARSFFEYYNTIKSESEQIKKMYDSLMLIYTKLGNKITTIKNLINEGKNRKPSLNELKEVLTQVGYEIKIPSKYENLLNIRQFALGRNRLDYSELTGKNVNIKGVNFEYNSNKIYFALAAGGIDYRYRDFGLALNNLPGQFMYMVRLGKGRPEGSHFYITAYKGRKQLTRSGYYSGIGGLSTVAGISAELKYLLKEHTSIVAEVAESVAPDYRTNPVTNGKLALDDKRNQALAVSFKSYLPKTNTRIEGVYKYIGSNFQSFSSFITTNSFTAWQLKLDQSFLKRKLRITGYLRQNIFTNPYIQQLYNGRVIFKSLQLTYKNRRMPVFSVGYMPVSQLVKLDNRLFETQFNSLTANISHQYKVNSTQFASSFMLYKFYNTAVDTGFVYYNALNIFFNQLFKFPQFSLNAGVNHMANRDYELSVLSGGFDLPLNNHNHINFGFRVNNFNKSVSKTGTYGGIQLNFKKLGTVSASYELGYLPSVNRQFVKNEQTIISFTQTF